MKTPRRLSVRTATLLLTACVLTATAVIVLGTRESANRHADARSEADRAITNSALYEDALANAYNEWITIIGYFTQGDPVYAQRFAESRAQVDRSLQALRLDAFVNDPDEVDELNEFLATHGRFAAAEQTIVDAIGSGDLTGAIAFASDSGLTLESTQFLADLRAEIQQQRVQLIQAQDRQHEAETATLRWTLGIGAMCAVLLLAVVLASYRWIGRPLQRASVATRAIAAGQLDTDVPVAGPSELAQLAVDVNGMAGALIRRSDELNSYLSKDLEARTAELERANAELAHEVDVRRRAEVALERMLESERVLKEQLRHQAFHDPLTGLANRARFVDRFEHALARAVRLGKHAAILFMDIDDFKSVNDTVGHRAGDRLLVDVAGRLNAQLRGGDTAARLGGDEFAVLLEDADEAEAVAVASRIIEGLRSPMILDGREVFVRLSMGIALGADVGQADELVRRADVAMYAAKAMGKGQFAVYEPGMEASIAGRLELANELQRAVERDEFVLHYQPSVFLNTGRIAGVEALVRWQHPTRGLLAPSEFVPVAEETGLILPIGRWVLREACVQARRWQLEFPSDTPLTIAVNVSPRQVHQPGLLDAVKEALRESQLPPETLTLEITETVMMQDTDLAASRLNELKQLGIRIAIDDFGTGYSSLGYLRRFPVDILKIDKSFIDGVGARGKERELAQSIIELGQTLNLEIVAEGIEGADQLGWLRSRSCGLGQGFYFAEPIAGAELTAFLRGDAEDHAGDSARTA
ncbi:MAG: EAL domain-containing protein [Dehalococcoidia bacterium]